MKITIYGSGYVGLVSGACLADLGHEVLCIDIDADKIAALQKGHIPLYEPGLEVLIQDAVKAGRLAFSTDANAGVHHGLLQFIAVGTPSSDDGSAYLGHVEAVAKTIALNMQDYKLIINKSTVPVGTADYLRSTIASTLEARQLAVEFDVASNPEFLKEGMAINDFMHPDRIILGVESRRARELLESCYEQFGSEKILTMDIRSAELSKYAANAMLASRISFMNEMAMLAEHLGADIEQVRQGIGRDPRIGPQFLAAGCGYGGSCFPKDVEALRHMSQQASLQPAMLDAIDSINSKARHFLLDKIINQFGDDLSGKQFALWGLSFKPHTDDLREASSHYLLTALWARGARVNAYDPVAMLAAQKQYGPRDDITYCDDANACLHHADALIIVTEWPEFKTPDFSMILARLNTATIFDGRNLFEPRHLQEMGINYFSIGR